MVRSVGLNHFVWDREFAQSGLVAGIDEAGRGCLSGPVVVAGVVWQPCALTGTDWFAALNDSKTLSAEKRAWLYPRLIAAADTVKVAVLSNVIVDYLNIFQAAMYGFELVAQQMPEHAPLCVDGNHRPASLKRALPLVKGDQRASAVAAAGVIAKVTRDYLVDAQHQRFPVYDFLKHKGYATALHRLAIASHGPCAVHRKSFAPIKQLRLEPQAHDALLEQQLQVLPLEQAWAWFIANYEHFSLAAAHIALDRFQKRGLAVLPSPEEQVPLQPRISFLKPQPDPSLLPLFNL